MTTQQPEELETTVSTTEEESVEESTASANLLDLKVHTPLTARGLGERLFLAGLSVSLLGLGAFYFKITDLALHYVPEIQTQTPTIDDLLTDSTDELVDDELMETLPEEPILQEPQVARVTYASLNVRREGHATAERIGSLTLDQEVLVLENDESCEYVKIEFEQGEGFVHRDYLAFQ